MLQPYHGKIRNIACLFVHSGLTEDNGERIYEIAAALIAPDRPEETFSSLVRYAKTTERDRHASGVSGRRCEPPQLLRTPQPFSRPF